jgi:hypothetical protein
LPASSQQYFAGEVYGVCLNVNDEMAYVDGAQGVALNGALVVVDGEGSERVDGSVVEEPHVFLLSVALVEPARSMKERAGVQQMRELDFARMLDRQEEYLALPEFLARLEHHQVVAYLVRSVNLREVSACLPSRVIEGLAI